MTGTPCSVRRALRKVPSRVLRQSSNHDDQQPTTTQRGKLLTSEDGRARLAVDESLKIWLVGRLLGRLERCQAAQGAFGGVESAVLPHVDGTQSGQAHAVV